MKRYEVVVVLSCAPHSNAGRLLARLREEHGDNTESMLAESLRKEYEAAGVTGVRVERVQVTT